MRDVKQIKQQIQELRYDIRMARNEEASEREMEFLYTELEDLENLLHEALAA